MKKKLLGGFVILSIAAFAAFNVNLNTQSEGSSLLTLTNVEALADNESGSPCGGPKVSGSCQSTNTVNCKDLDGCQ